MPVNISDDELMAYVDGELDPGRAAALKVMIAERADIARRVADQQALREKLRRSFDTVLGEPVPPRLTTARRRGSIFDLTSAARARLGRTTWSTGFGLAAGIVLGVLLGPALMKLSKEDSSDGERRAGVVLGSALEDVLSNRLASEQSASDAIRIGVSYLSKQREYCRTFTSNDGARTTVGLACRRDGGWQVDALQAAPRIGENSSDFRRAATSISPLVLDVVNSSMAGEALDSRAERLARDHHWQARE